MLENSDNNGKLWSIVSYITWIGWIIALGDGVRITGPASLVEQMREEAQRLTALYAASSSNSIES